MLVFFKDYSRSRFFLILKHCLFFDFVWNNVVSKQTLFQSYDIERFKNVICMVTRKTYCWSNRLINNSFLP